MEYTEHLCDKLLRVPEESENRMVQEEKMSEETGPVTAALGEYSEIAKSKRRQYDILEDFPWMWAIFKEWPIPQRLVVSNDMAVLYVFLSAAVWEGPTFNGPEVWVRTTSFQGDRVFQIQPKGRITKWANLILSKLQGTEALRNVVIKSATAVVIYRRSHRRSMNDLIEEAARM